MYLVFYLVLIGQITSLLLSLCLTGLKEIRRQALGTKKGAAVYGNPPWIYQRVSYSMCYHTRRG
jgi:uncharacterized MAPEG superfamily protein